MELIDVNETADSFCSDLDEPLVTFGSVDQKDSKSTVYSALFGQQCTASVFTCTIQSGLIAKVAPKIELLLTSATEVQTGEMRNGIF